MIPVEQRIHDKGRGDCARAAIASLIDMELDAVPHFNLHEHLWFYVMNAFLWSAGWEYSGNMSYDPSGDNRPKYEDSFNGYFYTSVPSRNFDDCTHAVVMGMDGVVAHDPSPKKNYQGENILKTGSIEYWYLVRKRNDAEWLSWSKK